MAECEKKFYPFSYKLDKYSVVRTLFVKKHDGTDEVKPQDRTLFVVNIPQYISEDIIKELFNCYGRIEKVYLQIKPSTGLPLSLSKFFMPQLSELGPKVCYVIFQHSTSLNKALKPKTKHIHLCKELNPKSGKPKWIDDYNSQFIDTKDLNSEIEVFMSNFDKKAEEEKQKAKEFEGITDEDGWVTVTKHSKKPKINRNEFTNKKLVDKLKRAQAKQTIINFYKCQIKNAKMDQIAELKKKFENDKKRLALMKSGRKFKPL